MELKEMIYKRKSNRKYKDELLSKDILDDIIRFVNDSKKLYPDIKFRMEFIDKDNVKCILPWIPKQNIAIFSEVKEGYLENIGFVFQQLDLYLHSIGIGSCWLGMGKPNSKVKSKIEDNMEFVMCMSIGYCNDDIYRDIQNFKRFPLSKISDSEDERLEVARLAPSSVNSQPWYFVHEKDIIHLYLKKHKLLSKLALNDMNHIDVGIALAHIYVSNINSFETFKYDNKLKGMKYIISFKI